MRKVMLLGAVAALGLSTPALAADGFYIGFDAGLWMPKDIDFDAGQVDFEIDHKTGFDIDLIAGHDFGFIRAEGELAWKRANHDEYSLGSSSTSADGDTDVRSVMVNLLGDVGSDRFSFYAGGGIGYALARVDIDVDGDGEKLKDGGLAWQGIAGIRVAMNEMIDIGLKYRYFDTSKLDDDDVDFDVTSHSIMFSFIYNMVSEPRHVAPPPMVMAPPPPAPPPPTQTCPDGSVILATDACPPPPPPPPPPPEPERG